MVSFLVLAAIVGIAGAAGTPAKVPNCTVNDLLTAEAVNCEDTLPAYCGSKDAKAHYLADTTYLPAAVGLGSDKRIIGCYSGLDLAAATGALPIDENFLKAAIAICPKTCGLCCATPAYNCKNSDDPRISCEAVTQDMCKDSKWRELIAVNCPNKCGFCLEGGCVDAAVDCDKEPGICKKPEMAVFAAENCKRTCGLCSNNSTIGSTTVSPGGVGGCVDNHSNCFNWVKNGFCVATAYTPQQKAQICGRSCNLCNLLG